MKTNLKNLYILFFLFFFCLSANGQNQFNLNNPSFEDDPSDATVPMGWFACASATTPDILPGFWGVYLDPQDGDSYIGLITRENDTYESIGQRLPEKLKKDICYRFAFDLAHADNYAAYNTPIKLRIWLSDKKCKKQQMIYESAVIESEDWINQKVEFKPEKDMKYIKIEAYNSAEEAVKGNILIDNISPIIVCKKV